MLFLLALALCCHGARSLAIAPPATLPHIVLPGFLNNAADYRGFIAALEKREVPAYVVPVERSEWINGLLGSMFGRSFWGSQTTPYERGFNWYILKVKSTVETVLQATGSQRVVLVGHSAGGWLARATLGDGAWDEARGVRAADVIAGIVTLGTPHSPGPTDMTRGALTYTERQFPGAFLASTGIFYVSVAGSAVVGVADAPRTDKRQFAYVSYEACCGRGDVDGDACVPLCTAHLEGAEQVTLPGVYHSITDPGPWYGSEEVVEKWLPVVFDKLRPPRPQQPLERVAEWLFGGRKTLAGGCLPAPMLVGGAKKQ